MNNPHSCLKIIIRDTDYQLGDGRIILNGNPPVPDGNWLPYFEFFERQMLNYGDTDGCVCFSTQESFDAQIEFLMSQGAIPAGTIELFNQLGYMDTNSLDGKAHFHSSPRWLQVLTGNGLNGNSVQDAAQVLRTYGPLPYKDLPIDPTMTPQEYVNPSAITQAMKNKAVQFLAAIGGKSSIQFSWITSGTENWQAMVNALPQAPLLLGVNVGNMWNNAAPQPPTTGANPGHCVMGFTVVEPNDMRIYDHYEPNPKDLIGYPIWYALQMIITVNPSPPSPPPPANPTVPTTLTWLQKVSAWLNNLLESITPTGRAKLGGASRSPLFAEAKKKYFETHLKVCAGCDSVKGIQVHHIKDFSDFPELELSLDNYLLLCEGTPQNCHLNIGHSGNFKSINPNSVEDAKKNRERFRNRPVGHLAKVEAFSKVVQ
ncbi:MAG: HNH endonuclease [Patescibacteria group bacterium]|nr:HNH endonuclease [Patescibacteria group bacterium]